MADETTTLYLTRHGQTEWNTQGRMQGHGDSPLTETGVMQAQWLAEALQDIPFDAIYSSSQGRAMRTAEAIGRGRDIEVIPADEIREMRLGVWEGKTKEDAEQTHGEQISNFWNAPDKYVPIGGESFCEVRDRAVAFLTSLVEKHRGETILAVMHGCVLKLVMGYFEQRPLAKLWNPPTMLPTSLSKVQFTNGTHRIVMYADTSHYKSHGELDKDFFPKERD